MFKKFINFKLLAVMLAWMVFDKKKRHNFKKWCTDVEDFKKSYKIRKNYPNIVNRIKNKKGKIRVLFLVNEISKWKTQSLYDLLAKSDKFEPIIGVTLLTKAHNGKDNTRDNLDEIYNYFASRGMNVVRAYENRKYSDLRKFEPDIIFYQQPWYMPAEQSPDKTGKYALLCYVPYYVMNYGGEMDYNQPMHKYLFRHYILNDEWANLYAEGAKLEYNPPLFVKYNGVISTTIGLVGTVVMYYFSVESGVSVSDYYAFNSAYGMLSGAFTSLAGMALTFATIKPIMEMAKPLLDVEPEVSEGKQQITDVSGNIEINNLSFRYSEKSPYVIDGLNLTIRPGQYVAIVGKTGCGKSTLMRLLLGFETPEKGSIYYDGKDIANIELRSLRRKIGVVMQSGSLFMGDIYSNIVISAPELTLDEAWEAAEKAGIADDIRKMPMGMHTLIAEGAGGISGGQKQRIMIARAIAPKPKILMLDEATSALDNITQKIVSESLDKEKCTRIVIAHRLSTIKQCDRIIVLDKGHIIEDGTYEELINNNGYFAELVDRQRIGENI